MQTLNANEAKTKFGTMLINIQSEPVEILKNGTSVAVVMSSKDYQAMEELKMELVKLRFSNIDEDDLVDGDTFFEELESGKYD
ncbi:type II toxin-antitoxin system Phd/YefM family antitoxin [Enterovibrio nigricans]|uniref:Antitoxin n=1 Tax=Enterovibrio nigricans DSM 22720 TaxID=1121868 RepID=A0A1T4WJ07_9GAMM|nr:type II toxin-antitoxin system Phd/YefM family antitoxin [Enterovibrio nigricans]PKF48600.1 type II toxin-antitoxin system Phd/YefM family antitoxin [Enterovibrio nigricans]SKA77310.1 prevent-host-death family protein [Enterovibrio nigricans DSM 22720]